MPEGCNILAVLGTFAEYKLKKGELKAQTVPAEPRTIAYSTRKATTIFRGISVSNGRPGHSAKLPQFGRNVLNLAKRRKRRYSLDAEGHFTDASKLARNWSKGGLVIS